MDVLSEPTALPTNTMMPVTNAKPVLLVLLTMLLLRVALLLLSIPIVHATKNTTPSPRHVSSAQLVKLVTMPIEDVLQRLRTATIPTKFNWTNPNAILAEHALLDKHSIDSPTLALQP